MPAKPQAAQAEAAKRIASCRRKGATMLDLSGLGLTSMPPNISRLTSLTHLSLSRNQLTAIPSEIGQLGSLTLLDVRHNRLSALPPDLQNLSRLDHLFLHGNDLLKLSPSVLGSDPRETNIGWASAKSILDFYFARRKGKTRPLNEVKLMLVGRGGAGKTSVARALRDLPFRQSEKSTPGIALSHYKMDECKGGPVTAHIWDFAGQVITHALHQFFFSTRCVYILVLNGRENSEREDAEYWLRLIKSFGTDSEGHGPPVLIALSKWEVPGCRPKLDREVLQERYPFIRAFVELDCKSPPRIKKMKAELCKEVDRLKWVREPFPIEWDAVRRAIVGPNKRPHMSYAEYRTLCNHHEVRDEGQQDSLAEILHNLGSALNYRNDQRLREATVLRPDWLTKNVYSLMRRAEKQVGTLTQQDVDLVLKEESDPKMRSYLMHLMERFEIAYSAKSSGVWLVPQALPDKQPPGAAAFRDLQDTTRLRFTYQALPEGLVARAIVRLHEFIEDLGSKRMQWGSGAILIRKDARALIRTEPQDRQVMITVTGPLEYRRQLAGLCQAEMRTVHADIKELDPIEESQVQGQWVSTAALERDEKRRKKTGIPTKDGTLYVDPTPANDAYSKKPARYINIWKPTAFVCYSKDNLKRLKSFDLELTVLSNEGLLNKIWHDRMLTPGENWNKKIQDELEVADVIIILVSRSSIATNYITKHEIPKAIRRQKKGGAVVIPIILEGCRWTTTPLGALNALPTKGKPLNKWVPLADGWKSVTDGLAELFEALIQKRRKRSDGR